MAGIRRSLSPTVGGVRLDWEVMRLSFIAKPLKAPETNLTFGIELCRIELSCGGFNDSDLEANTSELIADATAAQIVAKRMAVAFA